MSFVQDNKIQEMAEAYSQDAIKFAKERFRRVLDWSDESIKHVEYILDQIHNDPPVDSSKDYQLLNIAKLFGSYVGEVFRRNHGATWGTVTLGTYSFPGLCANRTNAEFWPWGKVEKRIQNGDADNVWMYYCVLRSKDGNGPELKDVVLTSIPAKMPWWRRLFKRA